MQLFYFLILLLIKCGLKLSIFLCLALKVVFNDRTMQNRQYLIKDVYFSFYLFIFFFLKYHFFTKKISIASLSSRKDQLLQSTRMFKFMNEQGTFVATHFEKIEKKCSKYVKFGTKSTHF